MAEATSRNRHTFPHIAGGHQTYEPNFSYFGTEAKVQSLDREEATKEDDLVGETFEEEEEEEEEWEADTEWNIDGEDAEGDVKDESSAYLEFLNEEVSDEDLCRIHQLIFGQAQKFGTGSSEDDDELEEEGLLETPLDQVEPYGLFKDTLMSKFLRSFRIRPFSFATTIHASCPFLTSSAHRAATGAATAVRKPYEEPESGRAATSANRRPPSRSKRISDRATGGSSQRRLALSIMLSLSRRFCNCTSLRDTYSSVHLVLHMAFREKKDRKKDETSEPRCM